MYLVWNKQTKRLLIYFTCKKEEDKSQKDDYNVLPRDGKSWGTQKVKIKLSKSDEERKIKLTKNDRKQDQKNENYRKER